MQREREQGKVIDRRRISKLLSLILRHRPDEFGLNMDEFGFIPLDEVLDAVQQRYSEVGEEDIRQVVDDSRQKRFEIIDAHIRALYGHSFFLEMDDDPMDPPEKLYMGSTSGESRKMREVGMRPHDRSYLHLSMTREVAESRSRQVGEPCVVEVDAKRAFDEGGVEFYLRGEVVLVKEIPADFVAEITGLSDGTDADETRSGSDSGRHRRSPPRQSERSRVSSRSAGSRREPAGREPADERTSSDASSDRTESAEKAVEPAVTYGRKARPATGRR